MVSVLLQWANPRHRHAAKHSIYEVEKGLPPASLAGSAIATTSQDAKRDPSVRWYRRIYGQGTVNSHRGLSHILQRVLIAVGMQELFI